MGLFIFKWYGHSHLDGGDLLASLPLALPLLNLCLLIATPSAYVQGMFIYRCTHIISLCLNIAAICITFVAIAHSIEYASYHLLHDHVQTAGAVRNLQMVSFFLPVLLACPLSVIGLYTNHFSRKISFRPSYLLFDLLCLVSFLYLLNNAVTSSGKSNGDSIDKEVRIIAAGWMEQYPALIKSTATRMIRSGINANGLDFTLPEELGHSLLDKKYSVFDREGGGVPWLPPNPNVFEGQQHIVITSVNRIPAIGTDAPEIIFVAWPIKKDVCKQINRGLGIENWEENNILATPPDLTPYYYGGVSNQAAVTELTALKDKQFACAQDANGVRYYFHTIVER